MFAVVVTFEIAQGRMAEFMPLMRENAASSLSDEPGCKRFDICTDPARPDEIFLYELYDEKAAFDAHLASAHFLSFDKAVADMIACKIIRTYTEVRS